MPENEEISPEAQRLMDSSLAKTLDIIFVPTSLERLRRASNKVSGPKINGYGVLFGELLRGAAYISFMCNTYSHFF